MRLLAEIDKLGSISAAARKLGMSYRYALERITIVEKRPVVNLLTGSEVAKRGVELTALGHELLVDYRGVESLLNQLAKWYVDLSEWSLSGSTA